MNWNIANITQPHDAEEKVTQKFESLEVKLAKESARTLVDGKLFYCGRKCGKMNTLTSAYHLFLFFG